MVTLCKISFERERSSGPSEWRRNQLQVLKVKDIEVKRIMSDEANTPSAAKLRHSASTIASDIAHAPLKSQHHETLHKLNADLQMLEKTMTTTSDTLTGAIAHVQDLVMESQRWSATIYNSDALRAALDHSLTSISGQLSDTNTHAPSNTPTDASDPVVSSEMAHP